MPNGATKKTASGPKAFLVSLVVGASAIIIVCTLMMWLWPHTTSVHIGTGSITADLATTDTERSLGLGGRDTMPDTTGMLFVFATDDTWRFWMQDMRFNLDIVWLNANKQVVGMVLNASPDTYPEVFTPQQKARYVLELKAGTAQKLHIQTGEQASFALPSLQGGMIKL